MDHLEENAITILRRDGRASYNSIAHRLGTNRMSVAARLGPRFADGSLRVIAAVHPRLLGFEVLAHVMVTASGANEKLAQCIADLESPVFISEVTGPCQLVTELHTATLSDLQAEVQRIRAFPGVKGVSVMLYEHLLSSFFLGTEPASDARPLDPIDLAIVEQLRVNGRLGYAELARRVSLSTSAARSRVTRMLATGVMQIGVTHGVGAVDRKFVFGIGISIAGSQDGVIALLRAQAGLELLARVVGKFSLVATVTFTSLEAFTSLLDRIKAFTEVQHVDEWLHVRIHSEQYHR